MLPLGKSTLKFVKRSFLASRVPDVDPFPGPLKRTGPSDHIVMLLLEMLLRDGPPDNVEGDEV